MDFTTPLVIGTVLFAGPLVFFGVLGLRRYGRHRARARVLALEERYLRRLPLPRSEGRRVLARQIERLADRHPTASLEWLLVRLHEELARERQ